MRKRILITIFFFLPAISSFGQNKSKLSVASGITQTKERLNGGLVFIGPQINFGWQRIWRTKCIEVTYNPSLGINAGFSKGMTGISLILIPADFYFKKTVLNYGCHNIKLAGNFITNYNYQVYPDLHGGHVFWFTELGAAISMEYCIELGQRKAVISITNSLFGFTSRPQTRIDSYNYSRSFINIVKICDSVVLMTTTIPYVRSNIFRTS